MINKEKTQTAIGRDEPSEFDILIEDVINISDDTLIKQLKRKRRKKSIS